MRPRASPMLFRLRVGFPKIFGMFQEVINIVAVVGTSTTAVLEGVQQWTWSVNFGYLVDFLIYNKQLGK